MGTEAQTGSAIGADWKIFADTLPLIVWVSDSEGRLLYVNRRWSDYTGTPLSADPARLVAAAIHPADRERVVRTAEEQRRRNEPFSFEYRLRRSDGAYCWHLARMVPQRWADGELRLLGTSTEIHELKAATFALEQANARLEVQGERLAAALMAAGTGTFRWNLDTDAVEWDDNLERIFGLPEGAKVGDFDGFLAFLHPDGRAAVAEAARHSARTGSDFDEEYRILQPGGAVRWIHARGRIVGGTDAQPRYMIGAAVDITTRREAEEALHRRDEEFRTLANSVPQLAWMTDATGYIYWYNQRWYEYTGTTFDAMKGWGWQSVHHPEHVDRVVERFRGAVAAGESWEDTFPLRRHDGVYRWFLSRALPIRDADGNVTRWFGTNTDITPQLEASEERERLLAAERHARAEAERANRAKSEFLAVMSHELRTPLNAIGGYTDLMQAGVPEKPAPAHMEYLERIQRSQKHLLSLINAVLNYARLEAGRVEYRTRRIGVSEFLGSVESMVMPQVLARGLTLQSDPGPAGLHIDADPDKTRQILLNLISNAVKFTDRGGSIRMSVGAETPDRIAIRVADTGAGIPEDRHAAIFDPFVQVDTRFTRESEGAGLGLAISRDLARGMGGDLSVVSEVGVGSTFTLLLPGGP